MQKYLIGFLLPAFLSPKKTKMNKFSLKIVLLVFFCLLFFFPKKKSKTDKLKFV